jgi:hypothetical protein
MGAIDTAAPDSTEGTVDGALVQTIEAVEEGDFLVLNHDTRTWEVTDIVDRAIEDSEHSGLTLGPLCQWTRPGFPPSATPRQPLARDSAESKLTGPAGTQSR